MKKQHRSLRIPPEPPAQYDPSRPLRNSQHEEFAKAWALGKNFTDAALAAGYTPSRARKTGSELGTNRDIEARKVWLQRQAANGTVLTIEEKRQFLADVVRTPVGTLAQDSNLVAVWKTSEFGSEVKGFDKLKAIALDNDLGGDGSAAKLSDNLSEEIARIRSKA